jgi:hypothetical protein
MEPLEYHVVGIRPVKIMQTPSGRITCLKMSWETGAFELGMEYLLRTRSIGGDVERLTEDEFIQHVESLRAERLRGEGAIFALYELIREMEKAASAERRAFTPEESRWLAEVKRQTYAMFQAEHPDPEIP